MKNNSPSPLSLFQLVQVSVLASPSVSLATLDREIATFIELLAAQNISARIWLKSTDVGVGLQAIEQSQQRANGHLPLYLFADSDVQIPPLGSAVRVQLQAGKLLKNEVFCGAISPSFWGAIIAQKQANSNQYQLHYCFDPTTIARIINKIREAIAIAEDTPSQLLSAPLPQRTESPSPTLLLTHLLHKQVQAAEAARQKAHLSATSVPPPATFFRQGLQELSTTLTRMKTALSLLGSTQLKVLQRQRYLELLQQECDRQNSLLSGMRLLMELDDTSPQKMATSVQLADIVPGIVSTYQPLAMEKGIQLGYTLPADLSPICCPASWLQQIVINLLNNSLQWTLNGGKVSVQASQQDEYVRLTFKDTGAGIAKGSLTKIFDSFYRERIPANEDSSGAGLGLTIVQKLLWRCGGTISASSQAKKGSTFTVLLPIAKENGSIEGNERVESQEIGK